MKMVVLDWLFLGVHHFTIFASKYLAYYLTTRDKLINCRNGVRNALMYSTLPIIIYKCSNPIWDIVFRVMICSRKNPWKTLNEQTGIQASFTLYATSSLCNSASWQLRRGAPISVRPLIGTFCKRLKAISSKLRPLQSLTNSFSNLLYRDPSEHCMRWVTTLPEKLRTHKGV